VSRIHFVKVAAREEKFLKHTKRKQLACILW